MNRLLATLRLDAALQWRNGFYYASLFVIVVTVVVFRVLMSREVLEWTLPYFLFFSMPVVFYFVAGLVLLEKTERTLEGLVVTPLRPSEYFISKIAVLTAMMAVENLAIVLCTYGYRFSWAPFLLGVVLLSAQYVLVGTILIARYDSIPDFLIPAVVVTIVFEYPFFNFVESLPAWMFAPSPSYGPLLLFQGAFQPMTVYQIIYAVLYSVICIVVFYIWARRSFDRFIVRKETA